MVSSNSFASSFLMSGEVLIKSISRSFLSLSKLDSSLGVCMAKTQYSFSDDASKLGAPSDFEITVQELKLSKGAGFVVALTGKIMTMPGLPKVPAANSMDYLDDGSIIGLS